ncbi:hypothetical protein [Roseicella sp. DB1501]|uniref:hypothetical protein n=1 Tax=Roseicella sp. DB1501 TaxID=2730925 RepID=UPI0014911FC5|nr:hypothetical protein [Roseicella sp. DB1501]NOG70447.1 hypothetical protein [Roseicella sp. DB1501]
MNAEDIRANHYARLNDYRNTREYAEWYRSISGEPPAGERPSLLGQRWEIDEAIYDEFLNMMPPLHWRGGSFYCMEECFDDYHAKFSREGGQYFCEYARLPRPAGPALEL